LLIIHYSWTHQEQRYSVNSRLKLAPNNVEISYLFRAEYQNFTYFFYVKDNSSAEILRYDIEKKEWFVGGYSVSPSPTFEKP